MAKSIGKDKSLSEKLKSFLGFKEHTPLNFDHLKTEPYHISPNLIKDLFPENPISQRLKPLKDLCEIVSTRRLEDGAIETMYSKTKDMAQHNSVETRHMILRFYYCIIRGQLEKMTIMRTEFFRFISCHNVSEDILVRLELLKVLSQNGKTITYFEEEIGPFLLSWFPEVIVTEKGTEYLMLVVNVIKYNATYLDDDIVAGLLRCTCIHCDKTANCDDIQWCLEVMDAMLCYSHVPSEVLHHFIFSLCLKVNAEKFSQVCWKLMRNLLGTSLGHNAVYMLCKFLQDKTVVPSAVRGAVFFIGMALWGSNKVESLIHSPSSVLLPFRKALDYNSNIIAYEVALSVQRLVKKNKKSLIMPAWEAILDIIEALLKYPELQESHSSMLPLAACVHDLITAVEESNVPYCNDRLYAIIETCSDRRDVASVIRLINHRTQHIIPVKEDFIPSLQHLLEKYFKNDRRQAVQLKILEVVYNIRVVNGYFFQEDAIDQMLLQHMSHVDTISDVVVKKKVVEILLKIAENCISERFFDILSIIEKLMKHHLDVTTEAEISIPSLAKKTYPDVEAAICGLISLFERKLHMLPAGHCIKVYNLLISHLQSHYRHLFYSEGNIKLRYLVMDFILKIRTNAKKQVGLLRDDRVEFSAYVLCNTREASEAHMSSSLSASPSVTSSFNFLPLMMSFEELFQVIIEALKQEKDWTILDLLFQKLPKLLENKALVISGNCNLNILCRTLCSLINDKYFGCHESLHNAPARFTRTEYQSRVFPVIACLAAYHSQMESHIQSMLIRCLQTGLVSSSAKVCIQGLTLCTLEMRNMMVKLMPSVLSKLSQISATVSVSVAMLEFLSNLIRLPQLYMSFVEDQYRSIFAIALPYTNPYKFNQYTVALAHHVIAMWFLKCRIPFRKEFAKYITKGLRNNIMQPSDDHSSASAKNESTDSSNPNSSKDSIVTLHTDLLEIGLDLMARFTFGMSSNAPKRSAVVDFLLEKGQKGIWLVGNKIITITTSGCGTKAFKFGLCERCYSSCREICGSMESDDSESALIPTPELSEIPTTQPQSERRRRHKSAFHRRNTTLTEKLRSSFSTKDDILLHREKSGMQKHFTRHTISNVPAPIVPETMSDSTKEAKLTDEPKSSTYQLCSCWCSGWAEIHIRRPTNNTSWIMRIQNQLFLPTSPPSLPLSAISSLLLPYKAEDPSGSQKDSVAGSETRSTNDSGEDEVPFGEEEVITSATSEALMCPKPKVPLRRTNSSPDMNSGWLNYSARQKLCLQSSVTVEEQLPYDASGRDSPHLEEKAEAPRSQRKPKENVCFHPSSGASSSKRKTDAKLELDLQQTSGADDFEQFHMECNSPPASNAFRSRVHTISVMSPNRSVASGTLPNSEKNKDMHRSGLSPSFVFLQLYHDNSLGSSSNKPLLLRQTEQNLRSLSVIDHIHPYDTHKIGVIYVGVGQMNDEQAILSNMCGSVRYVNLIRGLGNVVRLSDVDQELTYVGGLDLKGEDGEYALVWHDDVMRVAFHVATLMPNRKDDLKRNNKKTHIGNNFVTIVYNESNEDYDINTIKSQFTRACIIICPQDHDTNVVTSKVKNQELMETFGHDEAYIVSDESLPIFVRQMALHANLASLILDPRQQSAHVSNWLARLRAIKRLRAKVLDELKLKDDSSQSDLLIDDFTEYV